ncbi:hypothetical protein ACLB2K_027693 [Fragaria x ananassa]
MNWKRGRTIGDGSSATVSLARSCVSGEVFAVKSASISRSHSLHVEQELLSTLRCPQVVSYKGCNISKENGNVLYNLCLEYAPAGTLSDEVRRQGGSLTESTMRSYTRQILLGMEYLHANGIVHCDIKGHNILVTDEGPKLADLGCARRVSGDHYGSVTICGTPLYMAPEAARGEQQGFPADVWALGCTIIEMATGQAPWPSVTDPVSGLYCIGFSGDAPAIPSSLSKQGREFLSKCLKRDPLERWSASELLKHSFLLEEESYCWNSPTTVLDHGLWDLEQFDDMEWEISTCSNSARERIRRLSEGNVDTGSLMLNWGCDGDWVTVRSNKEVDILPPDDDQDYEDEATDTNSCASSKRLGLGTCNGSFSCRDMKYWPMKASVSKRSRNLFCINPNFDNEEFWFFLHDIV